MSISGLLMDIFSSNKTIAYFTTVPRAGIT